MAQLNGHTSHHNHNSPLKVLIIGAGLGGLACSISLLRHQNPSISVTILEKSSSLSEIGAGIQLPPNATKVMSDFGLLPNLFKAGMVSRKNYKILRWQDGSEIVKRYGKEWNVKMFGNDGHVMHRADYQRVLVEEARRLGVKIELGCEVVDVKCEYPPEVVLSDGRRIQADVVVGADGLRSQVRTSVLGYVKESEESGDLAYRITIPREKLENDPDLFIRDIVGKGLTAVWWGPNRHAVLYSIRNHEMANLVLICPDDLPHEVSKHDGDVEQMHKLFEGWDPRLKALLNKVDHALKWKIWGMEELNTWVKGSTALLGDACHPMVPYAALGAAMAVEDGAVLGRLIELFAQSGQDRTWLPEVMQLYQDVRKQRTVTVVGTANENRTLYHMEDGAQQEERDRAFAELDWTDENAEFPWKFGNLKHCKRLFGFDALRSADEAWAHRKFSHTVNGIS
ncbi:FAD-dependent monooxygenase OpS4 [Pseudocercospora fuligena]|uniref:FAD-dependent monooxygenase OpS4 n=1 Tax=Pseudocercospora fuligena TaxID=685502 RepID=A0A8H6RCC3_9PEZI|nr:FAD-dependent monooxygenase OpS4 [Pseudocercospora fuligena]